MIVFVSCVVVCVCLCHVCVDIGAVEMCMHSKSPHYAFKTVEMALRLGHFEKVLSGV